MRKKKLEHL